MRVPLRWGELGTVTATSGGRVARDAACARVHAGRCHIFSARPASRRDCRRHRPGDVHAKAFGYKDYDIELSVRDPQNTAKYIAAMPNGDGEPALVTALGGGELPYKRNGRRSKVYARDRYQSQGRAGTVWSARPSRSTSTAGTVDVTYVGEDGRNTAR